MSLTHTASRATAAAARTLRLGQQRPATAFSTPWRAGAYGSALRLFSSSGSPGSGSTADGTRVGRDTAWRQWNIIQAGRSPWLEWEDEKGRVAAENRVLDWVAQLPFVLKRKANTIKNKIGHMGEVHVEGGSLNPLDSFPRIRKALQMLSLIHI